MPSGHGDRILQVSPTLERTSRPVARHRHSLTVAGPALLPRLRDHDPVSSTIDDTPIRATTTSSYSRATRRTRRVELDAGERLEELPVAASSASGNEAAERRYRHPDNAARSRPPPTPSCESSWAVLVTEVAHAAAHRPTFLENPRLARLPNPRPRRHEVHRSRRVRTPFWRSAWWSITTAPPSSTPCRLGRSSRGNGGRRDNPSKPNSSAQTTADSISEDELREVDTSTLRDIAELAERRTAIDVELGEAVHRARLARRSRSKNRGHARCLETGRATQVRLRPDRRLSPPGATHPVTRIRPEARPPPDIRRDRAISVLGIARSRRRVSGQRRRRGRPLGAPWGSDNSSAVAGNMRPW